MKKPYEDTESPSVTIIEPADGTFVILGHNPQPQIDSDGATVAPLRECYVAREVPNSALLHILKERGVLSETGDEPKKAGRGRPRNPADSVGKAEGAE